LVKHINLESLTLQAYSFSYNRERALVTAPFTIVFWPA